METGGAGTPPASPGHPPPGAAVGTPEQLTQQMLYLTNRFAELETALAESERVRQAQAAEIARLQTQGTSSGSGPVGMPTVPSSGPTTPTPIVDTRVLGKPKPFKGTATEWPNWSVVFRCYCGAMSPQLAALMEWAEKHPAEVLNASLTSDQLHHSTSLFYILMMLVEGPALTRVINAGSGQGLNAWRMLVAEYEPKSSARNVGDLVAILQYNFGTDLISGFETFDRLVSEYDRRNPNPLQDEVKIGVVLRNLVDGPLKQHLLMTLRDLDTYVKLRNEVVRVRHAQMAAAGNPQPMDFSQAEWAEDLDALGKGKGCLLYTSPSPRDRQKSRMPSSA